MVPEIFAVLCAVEFDSKIAGNSSWTTGQGTGSDKDD